MPADGATLRYIVYDLLRDFKQRYSEAEISEYQLTYWVIVHADRLRKQHIQKIDSGEYIHVFELAITQDSITNYFRRFITLPDRIYDLDLDKGIAFITLSQAYPADPTFTTLTFSRTTPAAARRLYFRTEETPSITNPYFYRLNDKAYFLGIDSLTLPRMAEVGLYNTLDPTDLTLNIDQPFDFPQDLIPVLKRQVLDLGMFLLNVPKDVLNDGVDNQGEVPQKKFIGVNDMGEQGSQYRPNQRGYNSEQY